MDFSLLGLFGAGLLTFLSPCVLPLAPVLVASLMTAGDSKLARVKSTAWFALGFTLVFVAMGVGASWIGASLGAAKPWLYALGGVVLAVFGLKMMGMISASGWLSWMNRSLQVPDFSRHLPKGLSGLLFGAMFGLGWTPCVGPILGGVLTYVASTESSLARGAWMLFVFAQGIALPLIGVAALFERVRPWLARLRGQLPRLEFAAGAGLFLFAMLLFNEVRTSGATASFAPVAAFNHRSEKLELGAATPRQAQMVFFHTDHCPVCHAMESFLPEFEKQCSTPAFKFSKVNISQRENRPAAERFQIRAVPTISVLAEDGTEIIHLVGYQTEARLREAAKRITGLMCRNASSEQRRLLPGKEPKLELPDSKSYCEVGASC